MELYLWTGIVPLYKGKGDKCESSNSRGIRLLSVQYNNSIIHFIETRLQYNYHNNKTADGLVNRLASNLVILNQAHRVAWLIG